MLQIILVWELHVGSGRAHRASRIDRGRIVSGHRTSLKRWHGVMNERKSRTF